MDIKKIAKSAMQTDSFAVPKQICKITVQDSVPIYAIHEKYNLIETYPGLFTKMYLLKETNYQIETEDVQKTMFVKYRAILNSIMPNCEIAITVYNKNIDFADFRERILCKETGDKLDYLRRKLNEVYIGWLKDGKNGIEKKKYLTVGVHTNDVKKAAAVFQRLDKDLDSRFKRIKSGASLMTISDRLEILYDIYNPDYQGDFLARKKTFNSDGTTSDDTAFDFENMRAMGLDIKDIISPTSMQINDKYLRIGKKYARVMKIANLPNSLSDDFLCKLTDVNFNLLSTVNIRPITAAQTKHLIHINLVLAKDAMAENVKALAKQGIPAELASEDVEELVDSAREIDEGVKKDDEKLFKTAFTLMFYADTMEQLQEYTDTIYANCNAYVVGAKIMEEKQEEGFNTTLPLLNVDVPFHYQRRTLNSSSTAAISMPFSNLELNDPNGIVYSQNLYSRNIISYNRLNGQNFNSFILATSGGGKTFAAKQEIFNVMLKSNSDCIIIDPESEYAAFASLLGGETIKIQAGGGKWHINPMEIDTSYEWDGDKGEETNPVLAKADFILKLMESVVKTPFGINSIQETIIDECVHSLYQPFIDKNGNLMKIPADKMPTFTDLQIALAGRSEPEAKELAIALKLYTGSGSMNTFGFRSNVDSHNRLLVYDINELPDKLKPIAMLIIMDAIWTRICNNRKKGKNTWFWADEIHLLFADEHSAEFLMMLYKRARKYGGVPTGITQNVDELLESSTARKMLSNCAFVMMLNQNPYDREELIKLFNLSESQADVITSAPAGQGLIYTGTNCVPFSSSFPKYDTNGEPHPIYKVLTSNLRELTKFEEEDKRRELAEKRAEKKSETAKLAEVSA